MFDRAEVLISRYLSARRNVERSDFVIHINAKFKKELGIYIVEQFDKLQQQDTLEDYIDNFEHLRSVILQNELILPDSYILESFIGSLNLRPANKPFERFQD